MQKNLSSLPVPQWDEKVMIQYTKSYLTDQSEEIKSEFIDTLSCYSQLVNELDINQIKESYPEITKVIRSVQKNPFLCKDPDVADNLADSFLSFIMSDTDEPVQWTSAQIIRTNSINVANPNYPTSISPQTFLSAIKKYPKEYFQTLPNDSLLKIAFGKPDQFLIPYLISEMEKRGLDYPSDLLFSVSPLQLAPQFFVKYFTKFVDTPTISIASQILDGLLERPTLHLLCVKETLKCQREKALRALEMIGTKMKSVLPFHFPLSFLYHPSISEFIDEVENAHGVPENENDNDLNEILNDIGFEVIPFLVPFFLEFPYWLEKIKIINIVYHDSIINAFDSMLKK